jgi:hypothetical protein
VKFRLTAADLAELDVLVWELAKGYHEHRPRCAACAGPLPCPHVGRAIQEVLDWLDARILLTRAQWLRERQLMGRLPK